MASTEIHLSAAVHPKAELGAGVQVGPFCVVEASARLGDECILVSHVHIGPETLAGPGNTFYPFASIGLRTQDLKYAGEPTRLEIGSGNVFRENVTVNRSTAAGGATVVGNFGNFLAYSHIAHDCCIGDHVIFSNNGTAAGHVLVEDYAVIGGLTAVHQFCRIGRHAMTGGCSKIVQDVPPYFLADGNPARIRGLNQVGLERRGFSPAAVQNLKKAYRILCRSGLQRRQAIERIKGECLRDEHLDHLLGFVESSERGIGR